MSAQSPSLTSTLQDCLSLIRDQSQRQDLTLLFQRLEFRVLYLLLYRSSSPLSVWDLNRFQTLQRELGLLHERNLSPKPVLSLEHSQDRS